MLERISIYPTLVCLANGAQEGMASKGSFSFLLCLERPSTLFGILTTVEPSVVQVCFQIAYTKLF